MKRLLLPLALIAALAACRDDTTPRPDPVAMTDEATGHFCQMNLTEHPGPKAQVHLSGLPNPLFFSQVRDAVAFKLLPEQDGMIAAIYVSDMEKGTWDDPGASNWIAAEEAFFVTGSDQAGGMGTPELIPFGTETAARRFADTHHGAVQRLDEIPAEVVLAPDGPAATTSTEDDSDFAARLKALSAPEEQTP